MKEIDGNAFIKEFFTYGRTGGRIAMNKITDLAEFKNKYYHEIHYPIIDALDKIQNVKEYNFNSEQRRQADTLNQIAIQMIYTAAAIFDTIENGHYTTETDNPNSAFYKTYRKSRLRKLRKALGYVF